jgi:hypothetical protein
LLAIKEAAGDDGGVAVVLTHLATAVEMQQRVEEAEPLMRRALALRQATHGSDSDAAAAALNNVALVRQNPPPF